MTDLRRFFAEQSEQSRLKTEIVIKYLPAWVNIMRTRCSSLTYLDLFSGQGYYDNGSPSTPIKIMDLVKDAPDKYRSVQMHFYERDKECFQKLKSSLTSHEAYKLLETKPLINNVEIDVGIIPQLPLNSCTFTFIDPCGYQKLSHLLLSAVIQDWGCDCVFFLSTKGIRRNISLQSQQKHMEALFGVRGLMEIRKEIKLVKNWREKDRLFLDKIGANLSKKRDLYFLDFAVEFDDKKLTSHHIVFLTKNHTGYSIMKDIMADHSHTDGFGIPFYRWRMIEQKQIGLQLGDGLEKLKSIVTTDFCGQKVLVDQIVESYHKGKTRYTTGNIKATLLSLEKDGAIKIAPPASDRPKRQGKITLGPKKIVSFPGTK